MLKNLGKVEVVGPNPTQGWSEFQKYLERVNGKRTIPIRMLYAKKYAHILKTGNAQELLSLSDPMRLNVMKSLVLLSKYSGCYNRWKEIKERYQLKWSNDEGLQVFNDIYEGKNNYKVMMAWLSNSCQVLSADYANILRFATLTGLRPDEAMQSIHLIQTVKGDYLNSERLILEHFRHPQIFIRRTKKAFISVVSDDILRMAEESPDCGYNALRLALKRRGLDMNMKYCRKIFSTYLRMNGIESELIDLLQGRMPKTVFARHYFRPDFDRDVQRIIKVINSLKTGITCG